MMSAYHNLAFLLFVVGWIASASGITRRWCSLRIYSNCFDLVLLNNRIISEGMDRFAGALNLS